ncbi:tetratricopeptide repeat protein [Methanospirillum sp. J.3.6.1-F.2.7.3]|jgi:tetratricopeptide (TPR) repeat protein|uniref:Tetratricopeptide repeat protein n=2 Tax=Methanospirillum TaxID=2202 RepID=A0A8E7AZA3_9EURY|nr:MULTISPECIES: tetratricopeptide repeat protein [Methanospirillum]MDX8549681.1 tetratricopeptide repeat protein [Methanospirillum hungatei]NLW75867.1 tetratricopeptide repeat protein [Methanomicrobiales archaeon]QVV89059.1 tetratricopeptide repeat protein [Methanospirillum sp. J.3.6.1-F.2.7.3]QXO93640.1 tetratricopeptide repeat protein [Methanospirillum hungatei]
MSTKGEMNQDRMYTTLNPMIEAIFCKATECQMKGDFADALLLYKEIVGKEPNNVRAFQSIADVLDHMGNHDEALVWYDRALEYDPNNAETWYNKGMTLRKTGCQEEGLSCIRKGISLAMNAPSPRFRVE